MAISALERLLGKHGFEKYHTSRALLKQEVLRRLQLPGHEFCWKDIKNAGPLFLGDDPAIKHCYAQLYHRLTSLLIKEGKLNAYFKDNQKFFIVAEIKEVLASEGALIDYSTVFPQLKKMLWEQLTELKKGQGIIVTDVLDMLDLPGKDDSILKRKYRNYIYGRVEDLVRSGCFTRPEEDTKHARKKQYVRTAMALPVPADYAKYCRGSMSSERPESSKLPKNDTTDK